jgi:glycosyltransferase involved in cell wall biosynthesis
LDILHIQNFYNPGGSAKACYELAVNLRGHNQQFVGFIDGYMRYDFMDIGHAHLFNTVAPFDYGQRIIDLISYFKPDIIHVYIPGHESPSYFNMMPDSIPKVCTVLCGQSTGFDYSLFNRITFPSIYNMNINKEKCSENKCCVVRCGSSCPPYSGNEKRGSSIVFGRISAICPSKKIEDTLYCASKMPNNLFLVAGEVQDKEYCRKLLEIARDISNVEFHVNVREDIRENLYDRIDVLHYPTSNEAFCFSILEGMERGKAVLSYDNSAIKELSNKNNLILAKDGDLDELLGLSLDLSNGDLDVRALGVLNREVYEEFYTSGRYTDDILDIYMELIDEKKKRNQCQ